MVQPRTKRTSLVTVSPYRVTLAAVAGAWLGHVLEYMRVWGWSGFGSATSRQVHTYMGPVGIALLAVAFVGVEAGLRCYRRLERLVDGLADGAVDPVTAAGSAEAIARGRRFRLPLTSLLALTWILQLVLYVAQENAELRAIGVHAPVLSVVSGPHAWAPAVHLLVASVLVAVLWLLHRPVAELAAFVRCVVAWLLVARRRARHAVAPVPTTRSWTPAERFGSQLWTRPPPAARAA